MPETEETRPVMDLNNGTQPPTTGSATVPVVDEHAGLKTALDSERQLRRDAEKALRDAQEARAAEKLSEVEKANKERDDARAEATSAKLEALRTKVGAASGLPPELVGRLQGDTEDEMKKDADRIAKSIGQANGGLDGGTRSGGAGDSGDMNQIIRRAAGRNPNP